MKRGLQEMCTVMILRYWKVGRITVPRQSVEHASEMWGLIASKTGLKAMSGCGVCRKGQGCACSVVGTYGVDRLRRESGMLGVCYPAWARAPNRSLVVYL